MSREVNQLLSRFSDLVSRAETGHHVNCKEIAGLMEEIHAAIVHDGTSSPIEQRHRSAIEGLLEGSLQYIDCYERGTTDAGSLREAFHRIQNAYSLTGGARASSNHNRSTPELQENNEILGKILIVGWW
jgi:hypothetical protein